MQYTFVALSNPWGLKNSSANAPGDAICKAFATVEDFEAGWAKRRHEGYRVGKLGRLEVYAGALKLRSREPVRSVWVGKRYVGYVRSEG
jgi:hypothetical protein